MGMSWASDYVSIMFKHFICMCVSICCVHSVPWRTEEVTGSSGGRVTSSGV